MHPPFSLLTPTQERTADHWRTKPLQDYPQTIHGFANVVAALELHFISAEQWDSWLNRGSFTFRHKRNSQWQIRVFIDDNGRLAKTYGLQINTEAIVIGIDLTDRDPFDRQAIRQALRTYPYYRDPEAGKKKIQLTKPPPQDEHFLDILFLPPGHCEMPVDESRVTALIKAIEQGQYLPE